MLIPDLLKPLNIERLPASKLTGSDFTKELLSGPSIICYESMRMEKNGFIYLCQFFKVKRWLYPSKHLPVEQKMAMFLMTISHNLHNRLVRNIFQHLTQTVHKYFHEVLDF